MIAPIIKVRKGLPTKKSLANYLAFHKINHYAFLCSNTWVKFSWSCFSRDLRQMEERVKERIKDFEALGLETDFGAANRDEYRTGHLRIIIPDTISTLDYSGKDKS